MKKLIVILFIIMLSGCVSKHNPQYDLLIEQHFETTNYEVSNDTIKITVEDMTYEEIVARSNLLLGQIDNDITIKIYQYENVIPSIITLQKINNTTAGYTFNLKE